MEGRSPVRQGKLRLSRHAVYVLRHVGDDAIFCVVYGDVRAVQRRPSSAVNVRLGLFIGSLRGKKRRFSESEALFHDQGVIPGYRPYVLLLLGDIKGVLREIACFLRGRHAGLRLHESEL